MHSTAPPKTFNHAVTRITKVIHSVSRSCDVHAPLTQRRPYGSKSHSFGPGKSDQTLAEQMESKTHAHVVPESSRLFRWYAKPSAQRQSGPPVPDLPRHRHSRTSTRARTSEHLGDNFTSARAVKFKAAAAAAAAAPRDRKERREGN